MLLKKLEILGFKSFADKTTIHFSKGITAIVGPNGCGKTNILDALRWVLGEQRISLLRGNKMEEVVFNGTRDVKPLGMAEVVLSLVNNQGILPTEYNEVQITRRLFRSGESEYMINRTPCRLKDITELFYDTGMGAHSYSVIQQDMIESVISDKAEERRFLFEEAAGITKYKQRKKAALRKLEATENDFLRLKDIYAEVQTQTRSLKRQQKKAERYQKIANDIKEWEIYLSSSRIKTVEQKRRETKADHDQFTEQLIGKETSLNNISAQLETIRKEQIDFEQKLTKVGNEIYEISEKAHSFEKDISILKEKKSNASILIERNQNDIEALNERSKSLSEQSLEAQAKVVLQKNNLTTIETELKEAENNQAEFDQKLLAARTTKEQVNQKLLELEGKLSSKKTSDDNLQVQKDELTQTIEHLTKQIEENQQAKNKITSQKDAHKKICDEIDSQIKDSEKYYDGLTNQLEKLISENDNLTQEISNLTVSIEAYQARKNLLEEMILQYEGYESGVKAVMDVKEQWSGVSDTVAEKFIPVEGLECAVESALGEMAKFIICDQRETAESIISYLKKEKKGKIGILVPDTGTINPAVKRPELDIPEFLGWMDTFISTDDNLMPLMQAVLSRIAVFESGFKPDKILEHLPYGFKAVSTTGELYSKNIISGGSDDKFPLFRRKEKVSEQEKSILDIQKQLSDVKANKDKVTTNIAAVRAEIGQLSDEIETLNEEFSSVQNQLNETEYQLKSFDTEINRLSNEKNTTSDKLKTIQNNQFTLGLDYNQLSSLRKELESNFSHTTQELNKYETAVNSSLERVSSIQVNLVESKSKIEQTENKIKHLNELNLENNKTLEVKNREIENANLEITSSEEKITKFEAELKIAFNQRQEFTEHQSSLRTNQSNIQNLIAEKEKRLKEIRSEKENISENIHKLEMLLNSFEAELKSIKEKIFEDYDVDIFVVTAANPDENITETQAHDFLHDLKERLKKFGAVNLLALEEYRTASDREKFLNEQLEDLTVAKKDLQTTITKINQTARQMFVETFAKVKINFQNLFTELFLGGEADILLKDPNNPLESDIEIIARPRGKKLLSITMMSGGERALTAISLLFSLYLVKPSPFCILDEIDAPLDDANCHRFLKIIENFSRQTQFIIITHNKITMEASDNLYGVTMEKVGISKIVAVKFTHKESIVEIGNDEEIYNARAPLSETFTEEDRNDESLGLPQKVLERLNPVISSPLPDRSDTE